MKTIETITVDIQNCKERLKKAKKINSLALEIFDTDMAKAALEIVKYYEDRIEAGKEDIKKLKKVQALEKKIADIMEEGKDETQE